MSSTLSWRTTPLAMGNRTNAKHALKIIVNTMTLIVIPRSWSVSTFDIEIYSIIDVITKYAMTQSQFIFTLSAKKITRQRSSFVYKMTREALEQLPRQPKADHLGSLVSRRSPK